MRYSWAVILFFSLWAVPKVNAHGYVNNINVDGKRYVAPAEYNDPDIICHKGSQPAPLSAGASPGSRVSFTWNTWPDSHHGPVMTYMAQCPSGCSNVAKASLMWFKIDEAGLQSPGSPGTWASDVLVGTEKQYTVTLPTDLTDGDYVLRHEIIALHGAGEMGGAQNYPYCFNVNIGGGGNVTKRDAAPAIKGIAATQFYGANDPGTTYSTE
ncbi:MAG: Esterase/lipase/thioesterase [Vezdaea acicularis]|nr:MAG: Esterase/lipase/thioesterase [Vezdaea acicularis]